MAAWLQGKATHIDQPEGIEAVMRLFPHPVIPLIVVAMVAAALVVWFIAEAKVGSTG